MAYVAYIIDKFTVENKNIHLFINHAHGLVNEVSLATSNPYYEIVNKDDNKHWNNLLTRKFRQLTETVKNNHRQNDWFDKEESFPS